MCMNDYLIKFYVTVLGSLATAIATVLNFFIVVYHPVSPVDFPSFTICSVQVSSPSTFSNIHLSSVVEYGWHKSRTADLSRRIEGQVHRLPQKAFIRPPYNRLLHTDNNDHFNLYWINVERRIATARGHKQRSVATDFQHKASFARQVALNDLGLQLIRERFEVKLQAFT